MENQVGTKKLLVLKVATLIASFTMLGMNISWTVMLFFMIKYYPVGISFADVTTTPGELFMDIAMLIISFFPLASFIMLNTKIGKTRRVIVFSIVSIFIAILFEILHLIELDAQEGIIY